MFRYSRFRDAYVLRGIGNRYGPVLRLDRRVGRQEAFDGLDRRCLPAGDGPSGVRRSVSITRRMRITHNPYQRAAAVCCLLALVVGIAVSLAASQLILAVAFVFAVLAVAKRRDYPR